MPEPSLLGRPALFDAALHRRRLARALRGNPPRFLFDRALADVADRIAMSLRPFPLAVDLASPLPGLAGAIGREGRRVVRLAPIAGAGGDAVADPATPPLADGSVDLVASVLALHAVDDLPGALAQIRRALRPDGLFVACLPGGGTLAELRAALAAAEEEISGGASPRVHPFADLRDLGGLLQRAGFALPVVDQDRVVVRYATMFDLARDLRAMGQTSVLETRLRRPAPRALFLRAAEVYAGREADADGRIRASFEIVHLSGWAPHASQQKPLRPGSAKARLAEALGVVETPLRREGPQGAPHPQPPPKANPSVS
jgi:SAM-dependent methyltransferase